MVLFNGLNFMIPLFSIPRLLMIAWHLSVGVKMQRWELFLGLGFHLNGITIVKFPRIQLHVL